MKQSDKTYLYILIATILLPTYEPAQFKQFPNTAETLGKDTKLFIVYGMITKFE
jgi:hypothetical protein